ncbi:tRNA uridine-5-carboxymethylaminomethyl(34) synthesis GTPase MnmE [Succinispira mobilis]|uniref:tRNA uridine-5-carboxymethylaminomethyl(34) synthesis GTPase MnmE n=1 Tax=Succinispira mobilis TaxID=78120 RepID=UPI0003765742|nr:tRNA uridine-5-carboxymethylaminomethyl(34) synthesis GTPase MnmE [Succinispira mobilis]
MTIAAIATPLGEGGIGIVRLSGNKSLAIVEKIFQPASSKKLKNNSHCLIYGTIIEPNGQAIDEALVVYMRGPHSYTAEDVVEIQAHSSIAGLQKILSLVLANGARLANPGEFTQRAFLNGRLDLTQAEAVLDIIKSRTQASLKLAMRQHKGLLSKKISSYRQLLKDIVVQLEAVIDYPEEDIEDLTAQDVSAKLQALQTQLQELLDSAKVGKVLKEGLRVVITGQPNVGKSSLLNLLLQEERAIVSNIAGTTRDVIEEKLIVAGIPIVLVDTAGIRETEDVIEKIGVAKSYSNIESADLVLLMLDASQGLNADDEKLLAAIGEQEYFVLVNKIDVPADLEKIKSQLALYKPKKTIYLSLVTGEGMAEFKEQLTQQVFGSSGQLLEDNVYIQNVRHEQLLQTAAQHLQEAEQALQLGISLDCAVIDLRLCIDNLGCITGESVQDEIINEIFSRFCIGK